MSVTTDGWDRSVGRERTPLEWQLMSMRIDLSDLAPLIAARGAGFLLSSIMDSRPHAAHLSFQIADADDQVERRCKAGRTTIGNCRQQPGVSVLWPALSQPLMTNDVTADDTDDGFNPAHYSIIVDGEARVDGDDHVIVTVTNAVFHRPAPPVE